MPFYVGVDVSRRFLDVALADKVLRLSNDATGFAALLELLPPDSVVCMEATGVYYRPLALFLSLRDVPLYVVNPKQIRDFARSRLSRNKTDKVDARRIVDFIERFHSDTRPWDPLPEKLLLLSLIVRFSEGLMIQRVGISNRLHALSFAYPALVPVLFQAEASLFTERERVLRLALEVVKHDPLLRRWRSRLVSLPGFGDKTALRFLAYSGDLRRFGSARKFASYTGLTPYIVESGDGVTRSRISRFGSSGLRWVLYNCALPASRSHSDFGRYYARLVSSGKPKKVAMVALAHKLARAAWAVCVKD